MRLRRYLLITLSVICITTLVWWFYPRKVQTPGYRGTGPNPEGRLAIRAKVECTVDQEFVKTATFTVDGKPVSTTELALPRNKTVRLQGHLDLQHLRPNTMLVSVDVGAASDLLSGSGMMVEGECAICMGVPAEKATSIQLDVDTKWQVPDHAGEFNLIVGFYMLEAGVRQTHRRYAVVCPIRIE